MAEAVHVCVCGGRSVDMGHLMFYAQFFCDLKTALKMSIFLMGRRLVIPVTLPSSLILVRGEL